MIELELCGGGVVWVAVSEITAIYPGIDDATIYTTDGREIQIWVNVDTLRDLLNRVGVPPVLVPMGQPL